MKGFGRKMFKKGKMYNDCTDKNSKKEKLNANKECLGDGLCVIYGNIVG